ncbi:MAG: ribokinase [Gammaproteobacteria bacterium]|nr:ribokinase [Gammaproteobacteria bacterium]
MTDIVVVGSVNLDLSATVARLPEPGETITGASLSRFPGGKGANQALAARRLGANVQLVGCVGDDAAADEALALLREDGVDLSHLQVLPDNPTGIALICVAPSGENQIVVAPGANAAMEPGALVHGSADALICQLEIPADVIAGAANQFKGFFCANLAPAKEIDATVLQRADLVIVNETEAAWYGDTLSACSGLVATTYGSRGASIRKGGALIAEAEPPAVTAVDTVGAGDAFTAALTVALVEGQEPPEALRFACAAGAAAATRPGAQPSLPTRAEVEALLGSVTG